jgi:hypothetical protein
MVVKLLETTAELAMRRVTRSAGIGSANRSSLDFGVPMYMDNVDWDALTACRDGLTVVAVVMSTGGWIVKMMLERRLRRRVLQTKNGVQQRDGWWRSS